MEPFQLPGDEEIGAPYSSYTYDGNGTRVQQTYTGSAGAETTLYFAGGSYEVQSTNGTQTVLKYYSFAGMTVAMDNGTDLVYFLTDHLGSIVATVSSSGTLLHEQRYMPFGEVRNIPASGAINETDFGYTPAGTRAGAGQASATCPRWA